MTDEQQREESDEDNALEVTTPLSKATLSKETVAMLLPYIGPHLKWIIYALAITLICWGIGNGIAKVWTATQQPQLMNSLEPSKGSSNRLAIALGTLSL